jgi:hypothetical protein
MKFKKNSFCASHVIPYGQGDRPTDRTKDRDNSVFWQTALWMSLTFLMLDRTTEQVAK